MTFLYYPTKFERIIHGNLPGLGSYKLLDTIKGKLVLEEPKLDRDFGLISRECNFSNADIGTTRSPVIQSKFYGETFGYYWRHFPDGLLIVGQGKKGLSDCLLTRLINDRITSESFEIGDRIADFGLDDERMYVDIYDPLISRVPEDVRKWNERGRIPFRGNEEFLKRTVRSVIHTASDYILETQEPYIVHESSE